VVEENGHSGVIGRLYNGGGEKRVDAKTFSSVGGRGGSGREKGQQIFAVVSVVSVSKLNISALGWRKLLFIY
jgi:hypothetical protein